MLPTHSLRVSRVLLSVSKRGLGGTSGVALPSPIIILCTLGFSTSGPAKYNTEDCYVGPRSEFTVPVFQIRVSSTEFRLRGYYYIPFYFRVVDVY
jgi:hypothetical protein